MNICILGGGNMGTLLMGDLGAKEDISVRLLTSRPDDWSNSIEVCDNDGNFKYSGKIDVISSEPEDVISGADIIISTLPSNMFKGTIEKISPFVKTGAWIGIMPGNGGNEFYCKDLLDRGCVVFGFQRVFGISRVKEYGKSVFDLGKKKVLYIAAMPMSKTAEVCKVMEHLLNVKCNPLANYLDVTIAPANPILHTARLYEMFHDYKEGFHFDRMINFYTEWTDEASELLFDCDEEVQLLNRTLGFVNTAGNSSVKQYFEVKTPEEMTVKISNTVSLANIHSPLIRTAHGFVPDFKSRYFLEDFPCGLCIIKSFAEIAGIKTPFIDKILMWFEKIAEVEYYVDGKFNGKDLKGLPLPVNFGMHTVEDIKDYYK